MCVCVSVLLMELGFWRASREGSGRRGGEKLDQGADYAENMGMRMRMHGLPSEIGGCALGPSGGLEGGGPLGPVRFS